MKDYICMICWGGKGSDNCSYMVHISSRDRHTTWATTPRAKWPDHNGILKLGIGIGLEMVKVYLSKYLIMGLVNAG